MMEKIFLFCFLTMPVCAMLERDTDVGKKYGRELVEYLADAEIVHKPEVVLSLLEHGACVCKTDLIFGRPVLSWAVLTGNIAIVEAILTKKLDVNAPDQDKRTALMLAARLGFPNIVALLLSHGASIKIVDRLRRSALYYAKSGDDGEPRDKIVDLLCAAAAKWTGKSC